MEKYTLRKPLEHGGKTIKELNIDLDSLTKKDLKRCLREAQIIVGKKKPLVSPETNEEYQLCVIAAASGVPVEAFDDDMSARDYTQIRLIAQNFLLIGDSEEDAEEHEAEGTEFGRIQTSTALTTQTTSAED